MCSFTKKASASGGFVLLPQTPYRGSAPGPRWGTSIPQTPSLLLCPLNNPVRMTPLDETVLKYSDHVRFPSHPSAAMQSSIRREFTPRSHRRRRRSELDSFVASSRCERGITRHRSACWSFGDDELHNFRLFHSPSRQHTHTHTHTHTSLKP